jgi:tRNA G18 (ribose-2'-O)-methylase SpoU
MNTIDKPKTADGRNVIDYYAYWTNEAIIADLDERRHNFSVLVSNLYSDFNLGSVVRSSNAFLAKEVLVYGRKKYDRRATVGTHTYTHFKHVKECDNLDIALSGFDMIVGIDNICNALPLEDFKWDKDKKVLICFGQEHVGLPQEIIDRCHKILYIKQYGSVRSLNVGCASAITMFHYCSQVGGLR